MAAGGLGIAAVGEIVIAVPGHQGDAVGAGGVKAGGIEAVGLAGQQHGVQLMGLQGCGDLLEMVHKIPLFLFDGQRAGKRPPVAGSVAEKAEAVKVFRFPGIFFRVLSKITVDFSCLKLYADTITKPSAAERSPTCVTECLPTITATHALLRASFITRKRNRRPVRHKAFTR